MLSSRTFETDLCELLMAVKPMTFQIAVWRSNHKNPEYNLAYHKSIIAQCLELSTAIWNLIGSIAIVAS